MRYYKLTDYYPRDIFFSFSSKNSIDKSDLEKCEKQQIPLNERVVYTVDKFDNYLDEYDILPTIGVPLISYKLKKIIRELNINDCQFIPATIEDISTNKVNKNFFALNILNCIDCLDKEKSEIKPLMKSFPNGPIKVISLFFKNNALEGHSIVRMLESKSTIIVNSIFLEICKKSKIKGVQFIEEGNQLSPSFVKIG